MTRLRLSVVTAVAFLFGVSHSNGQCFSTTHAIQGIPTKSPLCNQRMQTQAITSCSQIYDPIIYTNAEPISAAPVTDYSTIIQLAKALNNKRCKKCGKDNCTCGTVKGGAIINKLIDALIYALINKKEASKPPTSTTPAQSGLLPTVGTVLTDVTGTVDGVLGTVSSTVASVPAVLGTVTGGSTGSSPTDSSPSSGSLPSTGSLPSDSVPTSSLPTDTPSSISSPLPTDMASTLPLNTLLAALL